MINNKADHILHPARMNEKVLKAEYAVRGELVIRAMQHKQTLEDPKNNLPFKEIILCNIGNPQELQQKPITFIRQVYMPSSHYLCWQKFTLVWKVLSLMEYPELMDKPECRAMFPSDAINRARALLKQIPGGLGTCATLSLSVIHSLSLRRRLQ